MQVVLDANVFISALISESGNPARIINRWLAGEFDILVSPTIVDEILHVTGYERIQRKYARLKETRVEFVELISEQAIWVEPTVKLAVVLSDESDNRYVECAVAGSAQYIVSGDTHLLEIGEHQGVVIVSPATFLAILDAEVQ